MTNLSPAARAIANAIEPLDWESGHCTYEDIRFISRQIAATALRAAANHLPDPQMSAHMLYAIADELEGAQ